MVNKKISELDPAATITGTEVVPLLQGGATKAATVQQLLALIIAGAPGNLDTFFEVATQMGLDETTVATLQTLVAGKADAATIAGQQLLAWTLAQAFTVATATRDANETITTAAVVWPDGATGTFTTDTASTAFPGAIDAYHVTHVLAGVTKTVTQPAVTRDAGGAVTAQPALTVA